MAIHFIWKQQDMPPADAAVKIARRGLFSPPAGRVQVSSGTPLKILAVPPEKRRDPKSWYRKILAAAAERSCRSLSLALPADPALISAAAETLRSLPEAKIADIYLDLTAALSPGVTRILSELEVRLSRCRADDLGEIPRFPDLPDIYDRDDLPRFLRHTEPKDPFPADDLEPPEPPNLLDEDGKPLRTRAAVCGKIPDMAPPRPAPSRKCSESRSLEEWLGSEEPGFSETLLNMIDAAEKKDSQVYNRANVSRQHFSKIRNNPDYKPTKQTAVAFAMALELDLEQTQKLIGSAGYVLNRSSKFDLIILYFLQHRNYDLAQINIALLAFGQKLLGM